MTTRVGFIVECGPLGAERQVIEHLAKRIREDVEPVFECLASKGNLLSECARLATSLLTDRKPCKRVFIVWDLAPPLPAAKPSCKSDRQAVLEALRKDGVDLRRVTLVCVTHEIEAWLLADGDALKDVISPNHGPRIKPAADAESDRNPKRTLKKLFTDCNPQRVYVDTFHAIRIVMKVKDLARLERVPSFKRFKERLEGV